VTPPSVPVKIDCMIRPLPDQSSRFVRTHTKDLSVRTPAWKTGLCEHALTGHEPLPPASETIRTAGRNARTFLPTTPNLKMLGRQPKSSPWRFAIEQEHILRPADPQR